MDKIPFYLVTGFLGSGKTTFLKNLLNEYCDSKKIAVIQNEFAPAKVDGKELNQLDKNFEILEINKGSVFCVCLLGGFIESLNQFVDGHKPDIVILEASGLSDPIAIAEIFQQEELSKKIFLKYIWCVVDLQNFSRINKNIERVVNQIRVADKIILNKMDLNNGNVDHVVSSVKEINPIAEIQLAKYCKCDFSKEFENHEIPVRTQLKKGDVSGGKPDISSGVIRTSAKVSKEGLDNFLREVSPIMIRLKGHVKYEDDSCASVQACFGEFEIIPMKFFSGPGEMVFMGDCVNIKEINNRFKELALR
ncbi:MAG: hypothetical protein JEY94_15660 [Melioribacteraceae bacterium]|nr:hypothetical protein [Melioribacteraceae bacterium]